MGSGGLRFDSGDEFATDRFNQKCNFIGTGAEILAFQTDGAVRTGSTAFCTSSGSGFVSGNFYTWDGTKWRPHPPFIGTGTEINNLVTNSLVYTGLSVICTSNGAGLFSNRAYIRTAGGAWEEQTGNSLGQTLTNKTISGGTFSGTIAGSPTLSGTPKFDNAYDLKVISTPSDPSAGYGRLYAKADDANNDTIYAKIKKSGAFTEAPIGMSKHTHVADTNADGGLFRDILYANIEDVIHIKMFPARVGLFKVNTSGSGSATDVDEGIFVTSGSSSGSRCYIYNKGALLSWAHRIIWYSKIEFSTTSSTDFTVRGGVNMENVVSDATNTQKKIGIEKLSTSGGAANYDLVSSDGTTRSTTATTALVETGTQKHYLLDYTPNTNLKLYVDGTLNTTKTTNLPNSGNVAFNEFSDIWGVRQDDGNPVNTRLLNHVIIGKNSENII